MKASSIVLAALVAIPTVSAGSGCSPAADPIGKGNAHFGIEFSPTAEAENACGLPSIGGIGSPNPPEMPVGTTASTNFGQEVTDGQSVGDEGTGTYKVKCTITSGGKVEVELEGPNTSSSAGATNKGTTSLKVEGSIDTDDGTGTAKITARTPFSGATASSDCELFAVGTDGDYAIAAGEARFTFVCEEAKTALDPFGICQTRGVVSVRDCLEE